MKTIPIYQVTVYVKYSEHKNRQPRALAKLAKGFDIPYEGGGIFLGGDVYEHAYVTEPTRHRAAKRFASAVRELGFEVEHGRSKVFEAEDDSKEALQEVLNASWGIKPKKLKAGAK